MAWTALQFGMALVFFRTCAASTEPQCTDVGQECHANGVATYAVVFSGEWRTPLPRPTNAMFSPLVGASHSACASIWRPGSLASPGIEQFAETGMTGTIQNEITAFGSQVLQQVQADALSEVGFGSVTVNITVDRHHPLLSLVSMVAPSPDWFVGVYDQTLCTSEDRWFPSLSIDLQVWDAGTDSGLDFTANDAEPDTHDTIEVLTPQSSRSTVVPDATGSSGRVARLELRLLGIADDETAENPSCQTCGRVGSRNGVHRCQCDEVCRAGGQALYYVKVSTDWRSPPPPSNGHFSPLTVASHSPCTVLWRNRVHASQGVQTVAETGNRTLFLREIRSFMTHIGDILEADNIRAVGSVEGLIRVDRLHPVISMMSMMAPSPDWYVGLDSIPMCSGHDWVRSVQYRLFPWDAGTDAGLSFTSANSAENPHSPLVRIRSANEPEGSVFRGQEVVPVATVTFERIAVDMAAVDSDIQSSLCSVCSNGEECIRSYDVGTTNNVDNTLVMSTLTEPSEIACQAAPSNDFSRAELIAYCVICALGGLALGTLFVAIVWHCRTSRSKSVRISAKESTSSTSQLHGASQSSSTDHYTSTAGTTDYKMIMF